jgi:glycolate oxidase
VEDDVQAVGSLLSKLGALDVYVLPATAGAQLIAAREKAFFVAKASGADDIVDAVVPRAAIPDYLGEVAELAGEHGALVTGCGHVGDGNVHLSVFQPDAARRHEVITGLFRLGIDAGGVISGEHGIGTAKRDYFVALAEPAKLDLLRRIKSAFDPLGILNPGTIF